MKWLNKLRLWKEGKIYAPCSAGKCLHNLDGVGTQYVEVDKYFEGVVYCSLDCMNANHYETKTKSASA
jgi:hypothetical protein